MNQGCIHLLTLSGPLAASSSGAAALRAYAALVPSTFTVSHYDALETLPQFSTDLDGAEPPPEVTDLREQVASADALVISTPDSVQGLPATFRNALAWLVGSATVMGKRVAVLSAEGGSALAEQALNETLRSMSATIVPEACAHLDLPNNRWDERAIIAQTHLRHAIFKSIDALSDAISAGG